MSIRLDTLSGQTRAKQVYKNWQKIFPSVTLINNEMQKVIKNIITEKTSK